MSKQNPGFYGGLPIPQYRAPTILDGRLASSSVADEQGGPVYRYQGLLTYEKPIKEWPGDIAIPVNAAGSVMSFRAGQEIPNNCVNIRFIDVVPGVWVSVNGGGQRKVFNMDALTGAEITSLTIYTNGTGTCSVQVAGTGD